MPAQWAVVSGVLRCLGRRRRDWHLGAFLCTGWLSRWGGGMSSVGLSGSFQTQ
jgi:hypothetical protein